MGNTVQTLLVESAAWFAWLQRARSFAYSSDGATFTARKQQRRSHWYWYAFARRNGKVKSCYLGRSGDLTIARLEEIACQLHPTLATGSMSARVYGARSAKAIVAQQQIEEILHGVERPSYALQKAALQAIPFR